MRPFVPAVVLLSLLAPQPSDAAVRRMFVTSVTGSGKLANWDDAADASGVAAGDAICQKRAELGGLENPSGYRAWLSDSNDDAYCRVHGLTGKKVGQKCGQDPLPAFAGPWAIGETGLPFSGPIAQMLYPTFQVYYAAYWNEYDNPVAGAFEIWTGTDFNGQLDYANCGDWDSEEGNPTQGTRGSILRTGFGWTYSGASDCDQLAHLVCFETGAGDPLPAIHQWGRLAFVSSDAGSGDLGSWLSAPGHPIGVAAGDEVCRQEAAAAALPNPDSFKAWLSDTGADAKERFQYDGPWIRLDRVRIASNLQGLTVGQLQAPLNRTETGTYLSYANVWTGTASNGPAEVDRCDDWEDGSSGLSGRTGLAYSFGPDWTSLYPSISCDSDARLYCLQDLPMIFADGFESADPYTWSSVH